MKKIIFIILIVVFIYGCAPKGTTPTIDFHAGTDGLVFSFIEDMPRLKILENEQFYVGLDLRNRGAYNITNGVVTLSSYEKYMPIVKNDKSDDPTRIVYSLPGRNMLTPEGGHEMIVFYVENKGIPPTGENKYDFKFIANACYGYETQVGETVCIDPKYLLITKEKKICKMQTELNPGSKGAPVSVTKIKQNLIKAGEKYKVQFKIFIENQGNGEITNVYTYYKRCAKYGGAKLKPEDLNVVEVTAFLSDKKLDCDLTTEKSSYMLNLKEEKEENYVVCSSDLKNDEIYTIEQSTEYLVPLMIHLRYGYFTTISKAITVEKPFE